MGSPVPFNRQSHSLVPRQVREAQAMEVSTELELHRHFLWSRAQAEAERMDAEAAGDGLRAALTEELALLRGGLAEAGQSAAGVELVARKVELLASTNNDRFRRRFGGWS
jgi:hypothetical protein